MTLQQSRNSNNLNHNPPKSNKRREILHQVFNGVLATTLFPLTSTAAKAETTTTTTTSTTGTTTNTNEKEEELINVYFGCGCFWHVQHEFVEAEKNLLKRSELEYTARAGYAGGRPMAGNSASATTTTTTATATATMDGKVCYHNAAQIADYGTLGHAEVVNLQIPSYAFADFVKEYTALFSEQGYRPDQLGDRGLEYRNVVGIPGGVESKYAKILVETSMKNGDKLDFAKGKGGVGSGNNGVGSDSDARGLVFVMDSNEYPFYVAEQYHQFHDGFNFGENYPNSYNGLAGKLAKEGTLGVSQCPNGLLGLGALGL